MASITEKAIQRRPAIDKPEFLGHLGDMLEEPGLAGPEALGDHGWDSLSVISFQAFLDERLGVRVPSASIAACETFDELYQLAIDAAAYESAEPIE
jgi:phosphopantetheine binding protein